MDRKGFRRCCGGSVTAMDGQAARKGPEARGEVMVRAVLRRFLVDALDRCVDDIRAAFTECEQLKSEIDGVRVGRASISERMRPTWVPFRRVRMPSGERAPGTPSRRTIIAASR